MFHNRGVEAYDCRDAVWAGVLCFAFAGAGSQSHSVVCAVHCIRDEGIAFAKGQKRAMQMADAVAKSKPGLRRYIGQLCSTIARGRDAITIKDPLQFFKLIV